MLLQVVAAIAVPGRGPRLHRWAAGLAYAGLSWVLVLVFEQAVRAAHACGEPGYDLGPGDNVLLVVTDVLAVAALVVGFAAAAAARPPHLAGVAIVVAAFAVGLAAAPRIANPRRFDIWEALGHHYVPIEAYSVVCGREIIVESAPARIEATRRR
ncbi:MAG: hypothetical protein ACXWYS_01495 [Gaiellaceae bacterium]